VNTHDHAPFAGFWTGRDLELRRSLGTLPARDHAQALQRRDRDRAALLRRLIAEDLLPVHGTHDLPAIAAAAHRFLARTPAPLLGISLDDLTAETEPVNVPGVSPERHPSWTRRLRLELETVPADAHAARILAAVRERARKEAPDAMRPHGPTRRGAGR
jgi:4-alpha-glucanotransferase